MKCEPRLMIEFGSRVDEYRIRSQDVEFRARSADGSAVPDCDDQWRQLTADDISLHLALHTIVGQWLTLRLLKTAPHVLFRTLSAT